MKTTRQFLADDFLLETDAARFLYAACKDEPIFDYHCHLDPAEIAANKRFDNLADMWLGGDHYKWRAMRAMGIDEKYITGNAAPYEKYEQWARTVENLIGNPLYHWTHLELRRYFGIEEPLTQKSARRIWDTANAQLQDDEKLSVKGILRRMNVYAVGTTDDPLDSLEWHQAIRDGAAPVGKIATLVLPSFRPDRALDIEKIEKIEKPGFREYIAALGKAAGISSIKETADVVEALKKCLDKFVSLGCRAADHGFAVPPHTVKSEAETNAILQKALAGEAVTAEEADAYKTRVLTALAGLYAERGIVMQLHLQVIRAISAAQLRALGPNTGFDVVYDAPLAGPLAFLLNHIEEAVGKVPKTVLYSLNPRDYYPLATIMGSFQDNIFNGIPGKMQLGSGWWFCDHRDGMEEQMKTLANVGLLSRFVGMLTDSRSFISYPRHEYFRRVLCNLLGTWAENGETPRDFELLAGMVKDISFRNAERYFAAP